MSDNAPASPRTWPVSAGAVLLLGGMTLMLAVSVTARNQSGLRVGVIPLSVAVWMLATLAVVGWATGVCGRERRLRLAAGCLWAGAGGTLPVGAAMPAVPAFLRAAMLAAPPLAVLGAALVGTDWSVRPVRLHLVTGLVLAAGLAHVAAYDPFRDPACTVVCSQVPAPLAPLVPVGTLLAVVAIVTGGAAGVAAAQVWRERATTPVPVVVTALLGLLLGVLVVTARWLPPLTPASSGSALVPGLVGAAVTCMGVLLAWGRTYRARRAVRALVRRLGEPGAGLDALPAPVLAVEVAMGDGRWVDVAGREVDGLGPPGATALALGHDMRVLTRPGAAGASGLVGRLGPADLVALSNARLAALTRAHQREVRESQRRIVAVSDAERLRIERDLHDGAQQRLVAAKLHLRLAEPADSPSLVAAEQQVQLAVERLRALAHGVFPRLLEAEGLTAALDDLGARAAVPMNLDVDSLRGVEAHLPLEVSTALYAAAAASVQAVGSAGGTKGLVVRAWTRAGRLTMQITGPAGGAAVGPGDVQEIADRVGAVGGRLTLTDAPSGWTLTAEVPCEWS